MKSVTHNSSYISKLINLLRGVDFEAVGNIIEIMDDARRKGKTIFFIGNGGSAATASHFVNDLGLIKMPASEKPFNARSLADNIACLTALANDEGYENIFSDQLKASFRKGDLLVAISGSGNSPNLLEAIRFAKNKGGLTIGLIGFDGGKMKSLCDRVIHFKTNIGEYGPVEDMHLILNHMIADYFISKYGARRLHRKKKSAK